MDVTRRIVFFLLASIMIFQLTTIYGGEGDTTIPEKLEEAPGRSD